MRFSCRMVPEVYQVFWAGMADGEFVAEDPAGMVVACCTLSRHAHRMEQHRAELGGFIIAEQHRGSGLARRMVDHLAVFAAREWQCRSLELCVRGGTHAEDAYRGLGFLEWARMVDGLDDRGISYDDVRLHRPC